MVTRNDDRTYLVWQSWNMDLRDLHGNAEGASVCWKSMTRIRSLESTWRKKRTYVCKLTCDLHTGSVVLAHIHTDKKEKCIWAKTPPQFFKNLDGLAPSTSLASFPIPQSSIQSQLHSLLFFFNLFYYFIFLNFPQTPGSVCICLSLTQEVKWGVGTDEAFVHARQGVTTELCPQSFFWCFLDYKVN